MRSFAFIFARGGSKGLPGKNIKPMNGKPLLCYSIDVALQSPNIDKVFVSTDDSAIAAVAKSNGAEVITRPLELASDTASEWLAWQHAIKWVQERHGSFDYFLSLPPTSPLRIGADVETALEMIQKPDLDICFAVTPASRNPYFNMVRFDHGLVRLVCNQSGKVVRRQDAPVVYDITTVVYASTPAFILSHNGLFDGRVGAFVIPKERAVDIDDLIDFRLAELLLKESQPRKMENHP